jgi:hypothetical protein
MRQECEDFVAASQASQLERATFPAPKYLHPIPKGERPFMEWSIDLITGLNPPDRWGRDTVIVAVDCFTKWMEAEVLPNRSS